MVVRITRVLPFWLLVLGSVVALVPLLGGLLLALQTPRASDPTVRLPDATHWGNFALAWEQGGFAQSLPTSLLLCVGTLLISVPLSIAAAYGLVTLQAPFRAALMGLLVTGIFLPVEAYVVPLYFDLRAVGLGDSIWGTIIAVSSVNVAFGAFWMRSFFLDAPGELVDAARLDGATSLVILTRILAPIARPHILALVVLVFIWTWNDLLTPMVLLSSSGLTTAPMSLASFAGQNSTNYVLTAAAAMITIVPVIVVYALMQRSFVRGIVAGSTK